MFINKKTSKFYELNNHILEVLKENPYLGLNISNDLKWNTHIGKITNKASSTLGFLRRNRAVIWDPYTQGETEKLERV